MMDLKLVQRECWPTLVKHGEPLRGKSERLLIPIQRNKSMSFVNEGRLADSPYVDSVWRGRAGRDCFPNCPAEGRWHMLLLRKHGRIQMSVAGPMTRAKIESQAEGVEWLVIKFKLGAFLPHLDA